MVIHRVLLIVMISANVALLAAQTTAPVPDAQTQAKALALVREVYKAEYDAAKTFSQKEALAKRLLGLSSTTQDAAQRYALLRVARDVSLETGGPTCLEAVDEMAKSFQIDGTSMKAEVLVKCSSTVRTSAQARVVVETGMELINKAIAADNLTLAKYLGTPMLAAARKARDGSLIKHVADLNAKVAEVAKAAAELKPSLTTLDTNATDAAGNLAAGKYHCFMRGDWPKGLPMLALGNDSAIRGLAIKELRGVSTPNDEVALADGWWVLAEAETGIAKAQLQTHAAGWYKRALPKLGGLEKAKAQKRLSEAPAVGEVVLYAPTSPSAQPTRLPKELSIDLGKGVKMEFVLIPAGEFVMGSPEAERQLALQQAKADNDQWAVQRIPTEVQHRVKITKPFYMGKHEVTQAQWQAVMGDNPSRFKAPTNPVETVSWEDVQQFLQKLNASKPNPPTGHGGPMRFALPTEAQWEYACRAGTTTAFCFGDNPSMLTQYAWSRGNSEGRPHPVGQKKPNAWGLFDMHGSLWEWCADMYGGDYYAQSPPYDPAGPTAGSHRVNRGGSWYYHPWLCRSAYRGLEKPTSRGASLGFRVVCR